MFVVIEFSSDHLSVVNVVGRFASEKAAHRARRLLVGKGHNAEIHGVMPVRKFKNDQTPPLPFRDGHNA